MSLRSKVVIESNLKPSTFGKPGMSDNNNKSDDFEEIYENPLEKSKPLPPGLEKLQELPRNEPEIMEFSNASKNIIRNSNNSVTTNDDNNKILTLDKPSTTNSNYIKRKSKESVSSSGITNQGFDDQTFGEEKLIPNLSTNENEKLVDIESQDPRRTIPSPNNGKNDGLHEDKPDISFRTIVNVIKTLDVNRYATKKTIAQGMLDIALLTANASQLKYILQIGKQHEFYILMLSLICVSIGLQVLHGIVCIILGSSLNINKEKDQKKACVWNNICLVLMMLTVAVNAVISAFDLRDNSALTQANATRGTASIQLPSGGR